MRRFGAFLQDQVGDYELAHEQLKKAVKGWKVLVESRDDGKSAKAGLFVGGAGDVPSSVLYRLGRCAEGRGDLAAAEKFFTWAMEVNVGDGHAKENLRHVVGWATRDSRRAKRAYAAVKKKRRKWLEMGGGGGAAEDREFETAMEQQLAFMARTYMLHSRLAKYGKLVVGMMEGALSRVHLEGKVDTALCCVVERGWEGRMTCRFAGRDSWQGML